MKSYCLKVKEMDDEEYSCIVSTSIVALRIASSVSVASLCTLPCNCKSTPVSVQIQTREHILRTPCICSERTRNWRPLNTS